jgi:hypothetical protein
LEKRIASDLEIEKIQAISKLFEGDQKLLRRLFGKAETYYLECFKGKVLAVTGVDIVHGLIESMITGRRNWDVEKYPCAYRQLSYYLKSEILNLKSKETKIAESIDIYTERNSEREIQSGTVETGADEKMEVNRIYEMIEGCKKYLKESGSIIQQKIFEGMHSGKTNLEIAKETGAEVREIENEKKKLKRKLQRKFPNYRIKLK